MMQATDDLIHSLSGHAGDKGNDAASLRRFLLGALFLSFAAATALVWTVFGFRDDFAAMAQAQPFLFKVSGAIVLAAGAFLLVRRAILPGSGPLNALLLIPGTLPFLLFAVIDPSSADTLSSFWCSLDIALLSVPAFGLILAAMRKGAPTSPARSGAVAGLLAGSVASAAHALACHNDHGVSVLLWYGLAIIVLSGVGALIGRRVLHW
jgi:hypothetical protein